MDHGAVSLKRLWPSLFFGAVGIIGISWQSLMNDGTPMDARKLIGLAAAIGALASWTAFAVGNARWLVRLHAVSADEWNLMTGVVTGGIALVLAVPAFAFGGVAHPASDWMQFTMVAVGLGISASIFGNALWTRMSRLLPLTMVGQMILFETLWLPMGRPWTDADRKRRDRLSRSQRLAVHAGASAA